MYTKTNLKDRGWSDSMIKKLCPIPDKKAKNPFYNNGPAVCLYDEGNIENIERTDQFKALMSAYEKRKKTAEKGLVSKKENLKKKVASWCVELPEKPLNDVVGDAIDHYNSRQETKERWACGYIVCSRAGRNSDADFLKRITVNYIRHELTNYDNNLNMLNGKYGKDEAKRLLRTLILTRIAEKYPYLAEEAMEQMGKVMYG